MNRSKSLLLLVPFVFASSVVSVGRAEVPEIADAAVTVFRDVTVVPMDVERALTHHTVVVTGDRITWVGPAADASPPEDAVVIEGKGRYLMPGLVDMHVHTWDPNDFRLFLANGITTVRNLFGNPQHLGWRKQIAAGEQPLVPTLYTAGPIVDGDPPIWPGSHVVTTPEDAQRYVAEQHDAGYQYIKVYNGLSRASYDAVVAAARDAGVPVIGHVPDAVGLTHALQSGQYTIEHLTGYVEACYGGALEDGANVGSAFRNAAALVEHYDAARAPALIDATVASGAWNCPTLVVLRAFLVLDEATGRRREGTEYLSGFLLNWWRERAGGSDERRATLEKMNAIWTDLATQLHAADARIILGTDTPNPWVVPGFAIHRELSNLVEIGMTPYEAFAAGTRSAAECLDARDEFGTVTVGLRADLLLLDANPLEDVAHVRQRAGVMLRGRWLPESELQERIEAIRKRDVVDAVEPTPGMVPLPLGGCCRWHTLDE